METIVKRRPVDGDVITVTIEVASGVRRTVKVRVVEDAAPDVTERDSSGHTTTHTTIETKVCWGYRKMVGGSRLILKVERQRDSRYSLRT